jgi:hypothetical protein
LVLVAVIVAVASGCGSSRPATLDVVAVERSVAESILTERHIYATVGCPASVPQRAGYRFTCTANLTVGTYPVTVTEVDDRGHVRYANSAPLVALDVAAVRAAIAHSIQVQRHLRARVSCPSEVLQKAGVAFRCTATVNGRAYPFTVTETDDRGRVRYVGN